MIKVLLLFFLTLILLGFDHSNAQTTVEKPDKDWVYLQNDVLRLGLLRSHGGAMGYLAEPAVAFNYLNHFDHGRLVQQSYYGDEDESRWGEKPWRFNPVQGGDYRGKAAKLVEFRATETTAYAKTVPRHWASGQLLEDCVMEQWVELDGPLVKVRFAFRYDGEKTHTRRHQETPAVFVSPQLETLATYTGQEPWSGEAVTLKKPGWPNEHAVLAESWAAFIGKDGKGVGVYVPSAREATTYRFQGGAGSNCSYIAPVQEFALKPGLKFEYTAYFTLGDVPAIRQRFYQLHAER